MKYIAKTSLNCEFGILKANDSFEADPDDERVARLMAAGKIVADGNNDMPSQKKTRKSSKKSVEAEDESPSEERTEEYSKEAEEQEEAPEGE